MTRTFAPYDNQAEWYLSADWKRDVTMSPCAQGEPKLDRCQDTRAIEPFQDNSRLGRLGATSLFYPDCARD